MFVKNTLVLNENLLDVHVCAFFLAAHMQLVAGPHILVYTTTINLLSTTEWSNALQNRIFNITNVSVSIVERMQIII